MARRIDFLGASWSQAPNRIQGEDLSDKLTDAGSGDLVVLLQAFPLKRKT